MATSRRNEGSVDPFGAELLRAGRADRMPDAARQRIFHGLGIMFALPSQLPSESSGLAESDTAGSPPDVPNGGSIPESPFPDSLVPAPPVPELAGAGLSAKGVLALAGSGVVAALAIWSGVNVFDSSTPTPRDARRADSTPAVVIEAADAHVPAETAAPRLATVPPPNEAQAKPAPKPTPKPTNSKHRGTLSRQLELVDEARAALQSNNPARALRLLNAYRTEFPRGSLGAEATVLRVEALVAQGNLAQARRVGDAFLKRSSNSPYSRRLRSLLDRPVEGAR